MMGFKDHLYNKRQVLKITVLPVAQTFEARIQNQLLLGRCELIIFLLEQLLEGGDDDLLVL